MSVTARNPDQMRKLQQEVTALKVRVRSLEGERPGRKPMPMLATKQRDVCAVDPGSDSARCPYYSLYRYQHGCLGIRCRAKQHEAYERRKTARLAKKLAAQRAAKRAVRTVAKGLESKKTAAKRPAPAKKRVIRKTPVKPVAKAS
jgi:hypothetical protein